ncbi:MAG: hypothetical protein V4772_02295 [Pseudomonadota bacterium]
MNSHSPTPSSERGPGSRRAATRSGGVPYMSERQTEAYLLARDVVRRIQRTSSLMDAIPQGATRYASGAAGHRHQNH